jgi:hypothetical protein
MEWNSVYCFRLVRIKALVNTVMNLGFHKMLEIT